MLSFKCFHGGVLKSGRRKEAWKAGCFIFMESRFFFYRCFSNYICVCIFFIGTVFLEFIKHCPFCMENCFSKQSSLTSTELLQEKCDSPRGTSACTAQILSQNSTFSICHFSPVERWMSYLPWHIHLNLHLLGKERVKVLQRREEIQ